MEIFNFKHEGFECAVVKTPVISLPSGNYGGHYCGYVGVGADHPFYHIQYGQRLNDVPMDDVLVGKQGPIPLMLAGMANKVSLDVLIDVHGSITFSEECDTLNDSCGAKDLWWFGFDCAHFGDTPENCNYDYAKAQCKSMAEQMRAWVMKLPASWKHLQEQVAIEDEPGRIELWEESPKAEDVGNSLNNGMVTRQLLEGSLGTMEPADKEEGSAT